MRFTIAILLACLLLCVESSAQLRLPAIISSGMVLQRNDSVTLWGWGYNGQQVRAVGNWDNHTWSATVNNHGKWIIRIKTPGAGGPYTLRISHAGTEIVLQDIAIGEVWLCSGQSNMEWSYYNGAAFIREELPACYNWNIRFFQVPRTASDYPQDDVKASWRICDSNSLKSFSAAGYYFGKKLQQELDIPVGLINASWGGTPAEVWTPAESMEGDETLRQAASLLREVPWCPVQPSVTYNGMVAPLTRYNIAGVIWYQGEANAGTNSTYGRLFKTMIGAWRKKWNKNLPFYYVQIAPFKYGNRNICALLQEQQTRVMKLPNTGMVVVTDLVDSVTNIHPSNKRDVGYRLANWALAETYGKDPGPYKSPVFAKSETIKGKLVLSFDDTGGALTTRGKNITGFYISGEQEEWLPAEVKIENDKIVLWNKQVMQPVYARYGFGNTIIGNVFSKGGLPLCPFRTDTWPVDQDPEGN